jgi:hypothetical protein
VLSKVRNLRQLSQLSERALNALLGVGNGRKLYHFFNEVPAETTTGSLKADAEVAALLAVNAAADDEDDN